MGNKTISIQFSPDHDVEDLEYRISNAYYDKFNSVASEYIEDNVALDYYQKCRIEKISFDEYVEGLKKEKDFIWKARNLRNIPKFKDKMDTYIEGCVSNFHNDFLDSTEMVYCDAGFEDYKDENFTELLTQMGVVEKYFTREKIDLTLTAICGELDCESVKNIEKLTENIGNLTIKSYELKVTLPQLLEAEEKTDLLVDKIKSLNLSPFEQYLLIHDFAASKPYNENGSKEFNCRDYIHTMISNKIVCVGYAKIMERLCSEFGIQCDCVGGKPTELARQEYNLDDEDMVGHEFNIVHLVDTKYDLNGYYLCDANWDSEVAYEKKSKIYTYAIMPMQDMEDDSHKLHYDKDLSERNGEAYLRYPTYSEPISFDKLKSALDSAYSALDGEFFDENAIIEALRNTRKFYEENYHEESSIIKRVEADFPITQLETKYTLPEKKELDKLPDF